VLAGCALSAHVGVSGDLATRDVWQVGLDVESKCTELLHVHTLASAEVVIEVSDEGSPDDLHLRRRGRTRVRGCTIIETSERLS